MQKLMLRTTNPSISTSQPCAQNLVYDVLQRTQININVFVVIFASSKCHGKECKAENIAAYLYDGLKLRFFVENISEIDLMLPEVSSRGIFVT